MAYGKVIQMHLVNGDPDSLIIAEMYNWNGKAIKIPRMEVTNNIEELNSAGIYFLFCKDENEEKDSVYIGEAEDINRRLLQHIKAYNDGKEPYYWNTAVVFTGNDLDKALIRYLENLFVEMARHCRRLEVLTKSTCHDVVIKKAQIAAMEEFKDNVKILIGALGYKVLEPLYEAEDNKDEQVVFLKTKGIEAKAILVNEGIVVLKGSRVLVETTESFEGKSYKKLRDKLIASGVINEDYIFTSDYLFSAPSAAASVICGHAKNGQKAWKTKEGKEIAELV